MNTQVKICGITRTEDALAAVEAGADALGFMFFERSPRYVSPEEAARIISTIRERVACVAVFVNPTPTLVRQVLDTCAIDLLQFHGEETPEFCNSFRTPRRSDEERSPHTDRGGPFTRSTSERRIIKAFRVRGPESIAGLSAFAIDAWLLDSYVAGQRGGTGARFNWDLAVQAKGLGRPIILAGGLSPANAAEAVRTVHPAALDVSSGVESSPGRKDPVKVQAFIEAAKQADRSAP